MGNNQVRYITNTDAVEIIGNKAWATLRSKFEKTHQKGIDFQLFASIIRSRFENMVSKIFCTSKIK